MREWVKNDQKWRDVIYERPLTSPFLRLQSQRSISKWVFIEKCRCDVTKRHKNQKNSLNFHIFFSTGPSHLSTIETRMFLKRFQNCLKFVLMQKKWILGNAQNGRCILFEGSLTLFELRGLIFKFVVFSFTWNISVTRGGALSHLYPQAITLIH